jgi:hypothetical protein
MQYVRNIFFLAHKFACTYVQTDLPYLHTYVLDDKIADKVRELDIIKGADK